MASLLLIFGLVYWSTVDTRKPWIRKAAFISVAVIYAVWMVIGIVEVIRGRESKLLLLGLPGGLLPIWLFLRASR